MKEILEVVNGGTDNVSESGGRSVWPDVEFFFGSRLAPTSNMWKCSFDIIHWEPFAEYLKPVDN